MVVPDGSSAVIIRIIADYLPILDLQADGQKSIEEVRSIVHPSRPNNRRRPKVQGRPEGRGGAATTTPKDRRKSWDCGGSAALKRAPDPVMRRSNSMPAASAAVSAETSTDTSLSFKIDVAVFHACRRLATASPASWPSRTNSKASALSCRYISISSTAQTRAALPRDRYRLPHQYLRSTFVSIQAPLISRGDQCAQLEHLGPTGHVRISRIPCAQHVSGMIMLVRAGYPKPDRILDVRTHLPGDYRRATCIDGVAALAVPLIRHADPCSADIRRL